MATGFRPPRFLRIGNAFTTMLLRLGIGVGANTLLTVPGRKSGAPRSTPITVLQYEGRRYVQSPFGEVDWVRNLRAAGVATLTRGRRTERIVARELSAEETAPILRTVLRLAPGMIRAHYHVAADASDADFVREARRHPCFELSEVSQGAPSTTAGRTSV
jgi:deazaflavin-dependent oxidoreductase (nitroreductase family)